MNIRLTLTDWAPGGLMAALLAQAPDAGDAEAALIDRACAVASRAELSGAATLILSTDRADGSPDRIVVSLAEKPVSYLLIDGDQRPHVVAGPGHERVACSLEPPPVNP